MTTLKFHAKGLLIVAIFAAPVIGMILASVSFFAILRITFGA